ncbi:hypothetical protein ACLOJK_001162 [Asimina triloba]
MGLFGGQSKKIYKPVEDVDLSADSNETYLRANVKELEMMHSCSVFSFRMRITNGFWQYWCSTGYFFSSFVDLVGMEERFIVSECRDSD